MKEHEKVIRSWRMQPAKPFGVHMWFDPTVESVVLLTEPTDFLEIIKKEVIDVDRPVQMSYLNKGSSVSGQAGGADGGDQDNPDLQVRAKGAGLVPF